MLNMPRRTVLGASALLLSTMLTAGALPAFAQDATPAADATPTATMGVLGDARSLDCITVKPASALTVDATNSIARYTAQEELSSIGQNTAIGETRTIVGQLLFDKDGKPLPCSRVDVDLRTLETDNSRRDNYLRGNTLETDKYPVATFILSEVKGLENNTLPEGKEVKFTLIGDLTFHGVTKEVAWDATATKTGDKVVGDAKTEFKMSDFNITPPVVGPVVSVNELVKLEIALTAAPGQ